MCCICLRKTENSLDDDSTDNNNPRSLEDLFINKPSKTYYQLSAKANTFFFFFFFFFLTRGTDGKKKAVMLSHDNVLKSLIVSNPDYKSHHYHLAMLPFRHCYGGIIDLFFKMKYGITVLLYSLIVEFHNCLMNFFYINQIHLVLFLRLLS